MTDNKIKKALECHANPDVATCKECPLLNIQDCAYKLSENALDLINRQQAEIERLKQENEKSFEAIATATVNRHQKWIERRAIKKLVERLESIKKFRSCMTTSEYELSVTMQEINDIIKEMVGETNG